MIVTHEENISFRCQATHVALTTDMWSSKDSKDSYNGLTIHYWVSENSSLKSRILDCSSNIDLI